MTIRKAMDFLPLLLALLFSGACNIFSPFHTEGDSDEADALLADAIAALNRDDPEKASIYLDKAKDLAPEDPSILYYHAIARMRADDIDMETFVDSFEESSDSTHLTLKTVFGSQPDTLFDAPEEDIATLLWAFGEVEDDLDVILEGLNNGRLVDTDLPFLDDIYLSCGVAKIVSGLILILDKDHKGPDFERTPGTVLIETGKGYSVSGPVKLSWEDKARLREQFRQGLDGLWRYYAYLSLSPCEPPFEWPPAPFPSEIVDDSSAAGTILRVAYRGIGQLFEEVLHPD